MSQTFDSWALSANWKAKPWIIRVWLRLCGRHKDYCGHTDSIEQVSYRRKWGAFPYNKQYRIRTRVCPQCKFVVSTVEEPYTGWGRWWH